MQLEEFYDYKSQFVKDMVTNDVIVKLLDGNLSDEGRRSLIYTQIFPYEYIPETVEEATTFICCDVDVQEAINDTFLLPIIYVWVFTHKSKLRLEDGDGGVRTDKICSEIAKEINGSRYYGLGKLKLNSVKRFAPMTDYQGKIMTFYAKDFNKIYDPKNPIPKNRKAGV